MVICNVIKLKPYTQLNIKYFCLWSNHIKHPQRLRMFYVVPIPRGCGHSRTTPSDSNFLHAFQGIPKGLYISFRSIYVT